VTDGLKIVVNAVDISQVEELEIERKIKNLSNMRHPLIAWPIEFAFALSEW
jgi:hypothetical protein